MLMIWLALPHPRFQTMKTITQTFAGKFENLEKVSRFVEENAHLLGFAESALYAIETAVDEAFSNIIDHAYPGDSAGDIECTCLTDNEKITIILRDHGQPFNPEEVPQPVIDCCLEDRRERGLGLFVMRKCMDEVVFDFSQEKGNTLTMTKYRETPA
jgi:serine/threonine-protein kinase RsbW